MKRTLVLAVLAFAALSLAGAQPTHAATTFELNIHNNTEEGVNIKLNGPDNYQWTAAVGKSSKTVLEGDYTYEYSSCSGNKVSEDITVDSDEVWITIAICGAPVEFAKFVVDSHLPGITTVEMVGPQTYSVAAELGSNKYIVPGLQTGWYSFSFAACGTTFTGQVRVEKNGTGKLVLYACEQMANKEYDPVSILSNTSSNLRIGSHYAFPVRITLLGSSGFNNYSFELLLGLNRFQVAADTYDFFYTAYGVTKSGVFSVSSEGPTTFTISPLH